MLYLLFELGKNRFAIEAQRVVEVLPLLQLSKVPHAPNGVAGFFNYRGTMVPVIDLCELLAGKSASNRFSTRIILISFVGAEGKNCLAGLIAEHVTKTVQKESTEFVQSGIMTKDAPYLGPVTPDGKDFIQLIDPERLLRERAHTLLSCLPEDAK